MLQKLKSKKHCEENSKKYNKFNKYLIRLYYYKNKCGIIS